ncbi:MAG: enoyl-CoA hydratase-related protein [Pseudooceanicola sp.]
MTDVLLSEMRDGLLILTMNRPEARNALDPTLCDALPAALAKAAEDPAVRAVMLTGAGQSFCVGGDVKAMSRAEGRDRPEADRIARLRGWMEAARLLHDMDKPTVAAINGAAAGAGLSLSLACDFRICAAGAKLTSAFAKVALAGDYGGSWFLTRLVGPAKARELILLSPVLLGDEAERIGLVTRAVPDADLPGAALAFAAALAAGPTVTLGLMKSNIRAAETGELPDLLDQEARHHTASAATADHREAAAAFVEKRQPTFRGE